MTRLTKKQRKRVGRYLLELARHLALRDWSFTLMHDPIDDDPDALAHVVPTYGRKNATITLCEGFLDLPADVQRHTLVHELVHCHLQPATNIVRLSLPKVMGRQAYDVLWEAYAQEIEIAVDALADALAPLVPLPPK